MVVENYFEQHKESAGFHICFLGHWKLSDTINNHEKKQSKEVEMFLINHCMHQSLCELVADVSFICCYAILDVVYFGIYFGILLVRDNFENKVY